MRFKEEAEVKPLDSVASPALARVASLRSRGPLQEFWAEFMDPGGTGAISRTEHADPEMPMECSGFVKGLGVCRLSGF